MKGNVIHTIEPLDLPCNGTGIELHEPRLYFGGILSMMSSDEALSNNLPREPVKEFSQLLKPSMGLRPSVKEESHRQFKASPPMAAAAAHDP